MQIRDKIEQYNMYFVEQELPNVTFYEIYQDGFRIACIKNNFNDALKEWCKLISKLNP